MQTQAEVQFILKRETILNAFQTLSVHEKCKIVSQMNCQIAQEVVLTYYKFTHLDPTMSHISENGQMSEYELTRKLLNDMIETIADQDHGRNNISAILNGMYSTASCSLHIPHRIFNNVQPTGEQSEIEGEYHLDTLFENPEPSSWADEVERESEVERERKVEHETHDDGNESRGPITEVTDEDGELSLDAHLYLSKFRRNFNDDTNHQIDQYLFSEPETDDFQIRKVNVTGNDPDRQNYFNPELEIELPVVKDIRDIPEFGGAWLSLTDTYVVRVGQEDWVSVRLGRVGEFYDQLQMKDAPTFVDRNGTKKVFFRTKFCTRGTTCLNGKSCGHYHEPMFWLTSPDSSKRRQVKTNCHFEREFQPITTLAKVARELDMNEELLQKFGEYSLFHRHSNPEDSIFVDPDVVFKLKEYLFYWTQDDDFKLTFQKENNHWFNLTECNAFAYIHLMVRTYQALVQQRL